MNILFIMKAKILVLIKWSLKSPPLNQLCWPLSLEWLSHFQHTLQFLVFLDNVFLISILRATLDYIPLKCKCWLRKVVQRRPIYL